MKNMKRMRGCEQEQSEQRQRREKRKSIRSLLFFFDIKFRFTVERRRVFRQAIPARHSQSSSGIRTGPCPPLPRCSLLQKGIFLKLVKSINLFICKLIFCIFLPNIFQLQICSDLFYSPSLRGNFNSILL